MSRLRAALVVAATDLRRRLRNRSFVIQALVGPILLATIISLAFADGDDFDATIGLVDADGSAASESFVAGVVEADAGSLEFVEVDTAGEARDLVEDGDLGAAVVVPAGFTASLQTAEPGRLEVLTTSDRAVSAEVARAVASGFVDRANAARLAALTAVAAGTPPPDPARMAAVDLPVEVTTTGTGGDASPAAYFGPAMGLLFLFLSVGAVARDLLTDERTGLLDRIRAGPVSDATILAGKGLAVVVTCLASLLVTWLVTSLLLGADWGDPAAVALLLIAVSLTIGGVAGLVAGVARTDQSAETLASVIGFVFAMIGGAFIPLGAMPEALQRLALLTPTGWALRGFADLSAGDATVAAIVPNLVVLLVWAVAAGVLAARMLPRRLGAR
jgi:ABC-2 type transport system permease protein